MKTFQSKGMSPVIRADTKFFGTPPFLSVDVCFRSRAEMEGLIQALTQLRDSKGQDPDHVPLQNYSLGKGRGAAWSGAEVTFHRPGNKRYSTEHCCVLDAARFMKDLARKRKT